jgi:GDP-L-fucose synthase
MMSDSRIYVAGHTGLVGSAIVHRLEEEGFSELILRSHGELDLERQGEVEAFFEATRPEYVFLAAARVGGILANATYPAEFLYSNLAIQTHVLHAAWKCGVRRFLFLGSSCVYPRECPQPMKEDDLLSGPLEVTNQPYAVAKIAGIVACEAYNRQYGMRCLAVMPTNLYGPGDNFDLETSHVLPALIRKFHLAKLASRGGWDGISRDESRFGAIPRDFLGHLIAMSCSHRHPVPESFERRLSLSSRVSPTSDVRLASGLPPRTVEQRSAPAVSLWGTGRARREFLHVEDMADAGVFLMNLPDDLFDRLLSGGMPRPNSGSSPPPPAPCTLRLLPSGSLPLINIGCGEDLSVIELAGLVREIVYAEAELQWDGSKPDGTPRKLLDVSRLRGLGWVHRIGLREGIAGTYSWYEAQAQRSH